MDLNSYIGCLKEDVINFLESQNIKYKSITISDNNFYDTELFVKFEYINNMLTLYFDRFKLNI
ncbi:MAG: hypothetical protein E7359_00940 [Clostridiales bacterium]|nr:hypothetical protein [Clostridiales bacterium]